MDLRPRQRQPLTGFTKAEVQKMEQLLNESKEQLLEKDFCKKLAREFNRSSGRAGKPVIKWTEVQNWFQKNEQVPFKDISSEAANTVLAHHPKKATGYPRMPQGENGDDLSRLEFEARSSKDGAWTWILQNGSNRTNRKITYSARYDVDTFLSHRFLNSGEIEVCVRYVGFGSEEDEWVNAKNSLRERSIALEHSECHKVNIGDLVVCFQERQDQARYYDARVIEIQRRWHDIRGCRCLFLIRYDHDNSEERVRLRRLCCRPNTLVKLE